MEYTPRNRKKAKIELVDVFTSSSRLAGLILSECQSKSGFDMEKQYAIEFEDSLPAKYSFFSLNRTRALKMLEPCEDLFKDIDYTVRNSTTGNLIKEFKS